MSQKLFEVTNDESLLSGVYFSPEFLGKREQWRKVRSGGVKSRNKAFEALAVTIKTGFSCQNEEKAENLADLGTDGTHVWER